MSEKPYTIDDLRLLFTGRDAGVDGDKKTEFDRWLEESWLEVDPGLARAPGLWVNVAAIEAEPALSRGERDFLLRHPLKNINKPVLPLPFDMRDFGLLVYSSKFRTSTAAARFSSDAPVADLDDAIARVGRMSPGAREIAVALSKVEYPKTRDDADEDEPGAPLGLSRDAMGAAPHESPPAPSAGASLAITTPMPEGPRRGEVYWKTLLRQHVAAFDATHGGQATGMQLIAALRALGDRRVPDTGAPDTLTYKNGYGDTKSVVTKTVENAAWVMRRRAPPA